MSFPEGGLPPLPPRESQEFYSQWDMQDKARRKYEQKWQEIRADVKLHEGTGPPPATKLRGRAQPAKPPQMFNHFTLNKDPEVSKYMPYDSVAYPKLQERLGGAPLAPAQLDTLWMSGLLDHVDRSAVKLVGKKVGPFLGLPGPGILPKAKKELAKMERKREKLILETADYTPRFEDKEELQRIAKEKKREEEAAGGGGGGGDDEESGTGEHVHKALTPDEVLELKRIARSLEPLVVRTAYQRNMHVYEKENSKIRKVLKREKIVPTVTSVACDELSAVFEITRRETMAAIVLQRTWKRQLIRRFWKLRSYQIVQVAKIQAMARGYITRRFVAAWYQERIRLAIEWQARVRGFIRITHFKRRLATERRAAPFIQKLIRGFLGRKRFVYLRRSAAALPIQRMWRGCVGRYAADLAWLAPKATFIQAVVRGTMARIRQGKERQDRGMWAMRIQRAWRGFFARKLRNVKLFDRETIFRESVVASLASESTYFVERWRAASRAYVKRRFEEKRAAFEEASAAEQRNIQQLEASFIELNRSRRQLSPRGIDQGWREELNKNIKECRESITRSKMHFLFATGLKLRTLKDDQAKVAAEVKHARGQADQNDAWREVEVMEGIERENGYKHERAADDLQKKIAHERRRWGIKFYTPSGKPDKLRRPGRPWDPKAFAGLDRNVFVGGMSDVFAFNKSVDAMRLGSDESLKRVMEQVQTQNFLNEVQSMDALLAPLVKPLQGMQHTKPAWQEQAERDAPQGVYPWIPTKEEMGGEEWVPPLAASRVPPVADQTRPPKFPSFPSPRDLEAADNAATAERIADRRKGREAMAAKWSQGQRVVVAHERPAADAKDAGYNSRMSIYPKPPVAAKDKSLLDGANLAAMAEGDGPMAAEVARRKERLETEAMRAEVGATVRSKKSRRYRPVVSRIPWTLLDELEAEKYKLKAEKALAMFKGED